MKIKYFLGINVMSFVLSLFNPLPTQDLQIEVVDFQSLIQDTAFEEEKIIEIETNEEETIEENTEQEEVDFDAEDLRYMASIIYAEAGNQCEAGQQAVGIVVMNRVNSEIFENSIHDVIYQSGQFTPVTDGNLNKALKLYDNGELPEECLEAAMYVLEGNTLIYYNNNYYEMNDYYFFSRRVRGCRLQIGQHQFK
jgi:spore germination cell wall hydrolase CwlJ-like protein